MRRWLARADTLALRLFVLMWVTLVVSHLVAFTAFVGTHGQGPGASRAPGMGPGPGPRHAPGGRPPERDGPGRPMPIPTFPSLPPTAGLDGPGLPWSGVLLDYGVRVGLIALGAWVGSRWLARPVRRLVAASQALGPALARGQRTAPLDEDDGTAETRAAAQVFNQMAAQIQHQFEARGLMIAAISHDLRTPLTRLRLRLETSELPDATRERWVGDLREMNSLIDGVLEVFRQPGAAADQQRTDVAALLQALVDDAGEQGAAVTLQAQALVMDTDPVALRRAVGNLVDNALRYAGSANVVMQVQADSVSISVDDDGPGIPAHRLAEVMQPFVRLDSSRNPATGGVGLGLFIARERAERLGGSLSLANRAQGGLRAQLVLPL